MSCMVVRGRDINFPAVGDETALHLAAQEGLDDSVAFLLANGADPNLRNQRGDTPLHLAVQNGNLRAVTLMLEAGAQTSLRVRARHIRAHNRQTHTDHRRAVSVC